MSVLVTPVSSHPWYPFHRTHSDLPNRPGLARPGTSGFTSETVNRIHKQLFEQTDGTPFVLPRLTLSWTPVVNAQSRHQVVLSYRRLPEFSSSRHPNGPEHVLTDFSSTHIVTHKGRPLS